MKTSFTILIVEDDELIRESLKDMLEMEDNKVITAVNGKMGLDRIRELKGECLVLLDLQMPIMTGLELLTALEIESDIKVRKVPVIVLTAGRQHDSSYPGIVSFLSKPIDIDILFEKIESVKKEHSWV